MFNTKKFNFVFFLFVWIISALTITAQSEIVLENDFENGTQKWTGRGAASVSSSKDQSANGTKSLRISGRSAHWHGGQLFLTKLLSPGKVYKFTVSVKLAKSEAPDEIKMTMLRGENQYDGVGSVTANANEWTTFSGKFKNSSRDSSILIYVEAARANTSYFIDDFKIELVGDDLPPQTGIILRNDFEDSTAQNWIARGEGVEMFSSNAAGSQSLKVTGRTAAWHGLALDISPLFFKGRTYLISLSAKLVKGQPSDSLKITMQQTPPKGEAQYVEVSKATTVTDSEWATLSGQYTVTTNDNNLLIYVEAANSTTSFFIDNFVIKMPDTTKPETDK
jgi:endo-1,4-beta-xylanase